MPQEISENPIPILLKDILKYKQTGELSVQLGKTRKSLFFSEGVLIYAQSNSFNEQLGVTLHLLGKITEEQYDYISGLAHSPDADVGDVLISDNFVSKEVLKDAILYQINKIAVSVFHSERGTWDFIEKLSPKLKKKNIAIPLADIIMKGGRKLKYMAYFKNKFRSFAPKGNDIPSMYDPLLTSEEKILFKNLEGCEELSNFEIISKLNVDPLFYWRTMVIFWLLEMVEFSPKEIQYNIGKEIQELLFMNNKIESGETDAFDLLGIDATTDEDEVESRYLALIHRYNPDRFGSAAAPQIKKTAESVVKIIEKAYRSLTFEKAEKMEKGESPIQVDMDESIKESSEDMTFEPIEIDIDVGFSDMAEKKIVEPDMQECIESVSEEETDESSGLDVNDRIEDKAEIEAADRENSQAIVDIREQTGTGDFHDPREEAKVFYLKARDLYNSKKYMAAVDILKQAVSIDPTIADYFFLLGKCQVELEFFDVDAERNYKKAIEIDSYNADYIYNLAHLFKRQEKKNLAIKCFQRVLEVNPRYVKAEIAINELKGKKIKKSPFGFGKK